MGSPDFPTLRLILPKFLYIKGHCLVRFLSQRQLLIRMDQYDDFVASLLRGVNYVMHYGKEHQIRIFPWTIGFNPKEETSRAAVWISFPNLSTDLFAKKSLLSIASVVGKPITVDKVMQVRSIPSTARVRVILDLLDKHSDRIQLQSVDKVSSRIIDEFQEVVYDNLPQYCTHCKHQGHDEKKCRLLIGKNIVVQKEDVAAMEIEGALVEKLQGDARRALARVFENIAESSRVRKEDALDLRPNPKRNEGIPSSNSKTEVVDSLSGNENQEVLVGKVQEVVQPAKISKLPSFGDMGVAVWSSTVSKKAMDLNNARDDAESEGWIVVSRKQSISPQIVKELNVTKEQGIATKHIVCPNTFEALSGRDEHQSGSGCSNH
ncbi:uncharacterized protein LOC132628875 [Lycium barbarum]|uniref:uncharacterized protein LOC132628875 n=1 Tax=Lycium barbarum TaxID=112863 RepID=UPI00293ED72B|nr:uncharacterized protein LOC132628875 [Lycium barbarum]